MPLRRMFTDDNGQAVKTVTAEQHAIDNPGHVVTVEFVDSGDHDHIQLRCLECEWWDDLG